MEASPLSHRRSPFFPVDEEAAQRGGSIGDETNISRSCFHSRGRCAARPLAQAATDAVLSVPRSVRNLSVPDPCGSRAEAKTKASGYGRALRAQSVWAFIVWGVCKSFTAHLCLHSPRGPANPPANPLTWIGRPGSPFSRSSGGPEPARHFIGRSHRRTLACLRTSAPPRLAVSLAAAA